VTNNSKQFRLFPEGFHQSWAAAHSAQRPPCRHAQLGEILRAEIGQLVLLAVTPNVFDRVQFRRVGRQVFEMDLAVEIPHELAHCLTPVHRQPIPNHDQLASNVPQ